MMKEATLDDVLGVINDFSQMVAKEFGKVNRHLIQIDNRLDALEKGQREHTSWLKEIDNRLDSLELQYSGTEEDIKYLYKLIEKLKADLKTETLSETETRSRLEEVEAIAKQLALRFGLKT